MLDPILIKKTHCELTSLQSSPHNYKQIICENTSNSFGTSQSKLNQEKQKHFGVKRYSVSYQREFQYQTYLNIDNKINQTCKPTHSQTTILQELSIFFYPRNEITFSNGSGRYNNIGWHQHRKYCLNINKRFHSAKKDVSNLDR